MAEKDENSLIGFDPLAWMSEGADQDDENTVLPIFDSTENAKKAEPEFEVVSEGMDTVESENQQGTGKVVLQSELKIQNVQALYDELNIALENNDIIEIDASGVSSIDTSSLQVLTVFTQEVESNQKKVSIDFPSEQFIEASDLLGLSEVLGVDKPGSGFF